MVLTIHIILLLFALGSSAYTLSRVPITSGSHIYQISKKPQNMFEFLAPKPKKLPMREIIYFKIIETPYKDHLKKERLWQEKQTAFDDSNRPFTNGPGFQFLDFGLLGDKSSEDDNDSSNDSNDSSDSNESSLGSHEGENHSDDSSDCDSDSQECNNESDKSNDSNSDKYETKPDIRESRNDSKDSKNNGNNSNSGNNDSNNESKINSNKDQTDNNSKRNTDNDKIKSGSSDADNKDADHGRGNENKENDSEDTSKNNGSNGNSGNNESQNDSNESKINSHKSQIDNNGENKADEDKLKSGSSDADKKDDDHGKGNENKENDSKNTSKNNGSNGNSGNNESQNDSNESKINSHKIQIDNNADSKADEDKLKSASTDADKKDDDHDQDNENKENDNIDTSKNNGNNTNNENNESKNNNPENKINSYKNQIDNNSASKADKDKLEIGSSDPDKNDDDHDKDNENKENDIKDTSKNNGSNGNNESKNDSNEKKINSYISQIDKNSESKANKDQLKSGSSDADKKDDDHDKDNENKKNDTEDTSKRLDGQSGKSKNINKDNITADVSQRTEPTAAIKKIEAAIPERNKQFDGVEEKYQEDNKKSDNATKLLRRKRAIGFIDNVTKLLRRKRAIGFIMPPPPPALQPLNVRMLPDFIQRMISNIPTLKNIVSSDERSPSNYPYGNNPQTYDFHHNDDKDPAWNQLPLLNQENDINEPSNMINKENQEEYQENNSPESSNDGSDSGSDDNSLYSDNDSGYTAGTDEENDRSSDDNSIGVWPNIGAPQIDFNNFKPYNPIEKENNWGNVGNKISKETDILDQHEPTIQLTTESNIVNRYMNSKEKQPKKAPIYTPVPKTKINIDKDLKERIEMSFDNVGKMVPPTITRFEENFLKTVVNNNEPPLTFGMKLHGDYGYVWNNLGNPESHFVGEKLDSNKEWNEPSSTETNNFNEPITEPTSADEIITEANKSTNSPFYENEGTTQRVTKTYIENQSQEPITESANLNEPNKESLDQDKNNSDDKKDSEPVAVMLDDLLKKDEFWQWLTKWTAAYIGILNEHVEELVKREVAKQVNKAMNQQNEKKKEIDKIDTNKNDLINENETVANVTTVEPANNTNEINTNITTTEKSIPELNNTDDKIAPEKDQINAMNKTTPKIHKGNKTTPASAHTIYGNAIDSDHVTNIFFFYPNAANNATVKDIEEMLGNKDNNVMVLGKPSNDNKESKTPESSTNSPFDDTTGIYAIDPKKDIVSNSSEPTSEGPETAISKDPSAANLSTTAKNEDTTTTTKIDTSNATEATTGSNTELNANTVTDAVSTNATESTTATESTNATESTSANNIETTTDTATSSTTVVTDTSTSSK